MLLPRTISAWVFRTVESNGRNAQGRGQVKGSGVARDDKLRHGDQRGELPDPSSRWCQLGGPLREIDQPARGLEVTRSPTHYARMAGFRQLLGQPCVAFDRPLFVASGGTDKRVQKHGRSLLHAFGAVVCGAQLIHFGGVVRESAFGRLAFPAKSPEKVEVLLDPVHAA